MLWAARRAAAAQGLLLRRAVGGAPTAKSRFVVAAAYACPLAWRAYSFVWSYIAVWNFRLWWAIRHAAHKILSLTICAHCLHCLTSSAQAAAGSRQLVKPPSSCSLQNVPLACAWPPFLSRTLPCCLKLRALSLRGCPVACQPRLRITTTKLCRLLSCHRAKRKLHCCCALFQDLGPFLGATGGFAAGEKGIRMLVEQGELRLRGPNDPVKKQVRRARAHGCNSWHRQLACADKLLGATAPLRLMVPPVFKL